MTFWPLTSYSDFPTDQTFHQFDDLDTELGLHRITSGFYGALVTGVACQQGTLTLPDTWFRPPFGDLLMLQLLRPVFPNVSCRVLSELFALNTPLYFLDFYCRLDHHLKTGWEIPSDTYSWNEISPNSEYDLKNFPYVFAACDIANPVSVV